uniref:Uncharacterized protein n=1 Tax=Arundo donax TaxID=35708 RepID=A0A0A8ZTU5_ARUDO
MKALKYQDRPRKREKTSPTGKLHETFYTSNGRNNLKLVLHAGLYL